MGDLKIKTATGGETTIGEVACEALRSSLRGELATPGSDGYEEARTIWNAMIDRRPAAIARCRGAADVMRAVDFAREHSLLLAVRGGGHNIAGNAVCEGGFMIDLSLMNTTWVDPQARIARAGPGVTLGDLDHETQAFGLATPVGINSTTGVAGLTLGGGFGWLSRKWGLTIDNLLSADVVTAEGKLLRASEKENPDLFWGIRGGGGNFGIVTSFEFQLHPLGPNVLSGLIVYPSADAEAVLKAYRDFGADAPEDLCVWGVLRSAPPLPFLPEKVHGTDILVLALVYAGPAEEGKRIIEPLRGFASPVGEHVGVQPYVAFQAAFDPLLTPGARNYWKSHNLSTLNDGAIDVLVDYSGKLPSPQCEIFIGQLGGATDRVDPSATAYTGRGAKFVVNVHGRWENAADDDKCITWAREFFDSLAPHATGGGYINFMTQDEGERIQSAYGVNYDRLVELKNKYDPTNLFRLNQNIKPTV